MNALAIDVVMDADGDLPVFCRLTAGQPTIAQRVRVRTQTHLGDWPLQKSAGIDWLSFLSGQKPADSEGLAAALAVEWAGVPGIVAVEDLDWDDSVAGQLTISAVLRTITGETLTALVMAPGDGINPSIAVSSRRGSGRIA